MAGYVGGYYPDVKQPNPVFVKPPGVVSGDFMVFMIALNLFMSFCS